MKAKVIIEEEETQIILTPETPFEKRIIEDMENIYNTNETVVQPTSNYGYGSRSDYKIEITIRTTRKQ